MQDSLKKENTLHVEGRDENKCLIELLKSYDLANELPGFPQICVQSGYVGVLDSIKPSIKSSDGKTQGFVIDANESFESRWKAIRSRLLTVGVDVQGDLPENGFVGYSDTFMTKVGVWVMPNNQTFGIFENFLSTLFSTSDPLPPLASKATIEAKELGAKFNDNNLGKAELYTWLAWQEKPGKPPWMAFYKGYFQQSSELSDTFIKWFKDLYELP